MITNIIMWIGKLKEKYCLAGLKTNMKKSDYLAVRNLKIESLHVDDVK